ncbi:MAG: peptidase M15 [Tannerellaceae bacterium]|jgi:hypothetical protein|nr:peptidase M15 [Tannerellaceae bacterium]
MMEERQDMPAGRLSEHFDWEEMIYSETAEKQAIRNMPDDESRRSVEALVKRTLEPLRQAYGAPVRISSGYRCPELNTRVGGKPSSQHTKGEAADCTAGDILQLLGVLLAHKIPFDQAILYRKRNFLHLSLRKEWNRGQVIIHD